ncbi:molybdenum cofactor synthesis domain-containing protein [Methanocaldococcus villosus KIN24-T80]|uniref:Molybdenum cofactor synthesis domain-containing protein n=1 Tax=Methanocaldococcus villosus KIN24-T80 TaxID=1069083 RepID=N6VS01_9EURY|nr:molybdopterin molybdotransferase MoeA [Methanocaldococcus villosus]ENN96655.1 molybdenum cofactor synthesis domain-containing protein [Methanocaldococcus villosus KIN24-T80]
MIKKLTSFKEAEKKVFSKIDSYVKNKIKIVPLIDAINKVSAEEIIANENLPYFNKAAMDGYAVIAEDTYGASYTNPIILELSNDVEHGKAKKVFTGDPIPDNTNAVIMKEFCREENGLLEIYKTVHPNENVAKIGEDVKKGDVIINKHEKITPYHINLLASLAIKEIAIYDLKFGIIATGDELEDLENANLEKLKRTKKIVNSNSYMLYALIKDLGFDGKIYGIVRDDKDMLKEMIKKALKENDFIITTGGTSVGDRDLTVKAIKELGNIILHGVNIRPGKPFGLGEVNNKLIFLLSGYPVASAVQFELFIYRYFLKRKSVVLPLKRSLASELGRVDFVRVKIDSGVEPIRISGSGVITSLVKCDGYILIPENVEGYEKGEMVEVFIL